MAEKKKAHYNLASVQEAARRGELQMTRTAVRNAAALGLSTSDMMQVVQSLTNANLYKSMTTHADHKVWQDVYRVKGVPPHLYIKISQSPVSQYLVIQFKEL